MVRLATTHHGMALHLEGCLCLLVCKYGEDDLDHPLKQTSFTLLNVSRPVQICPATLD